MEIRVLKKLLGLLLEDCHAFSGGCNVLYHLEVEGFR